MNNLFIPVVVLVQVTTIVAALTLIEALRINDNGGLDAIVYTITAVLIFIFPYVWSSKLYCSGIKKRHSRLS